MQVGPLYLAEMAPAKLRGTLNVIFQLMVTIGILVAALINYGSQHIHTWGWRLPLALAGAPGIFILLAGVVLPESPNSLAERGKYTQAAQVCSLPISSHRNAPCYCHTSLWKRHAQCYLHTHEPFSHLSALHLKRKTSWSDKRI